MSIKNYYVEVFCKTQQRVVKVYIRCFLVNNKITFAECNGCDSGYNASPTCKDCVDKCLKVFLQDISSNQ